MLRHQVLKLQVLKAFTINIATNILSPASAIPSQDEVATDAATLISALGDILFLVLTSSAFRLILSDFLGIFREIVANSAEKVKMAAATVKDVAETVEVDMRSAGVVERDIQLPHEPAAQSISVKDTLIGRFEDVSRSPIRGGSELNCIRSFARRKLHRGTMPL